MIWLHKKLFFFINAQICTGLIYFISSIVHLHVWQGFHEWLFAHLLYQPCAAAFLVLGVWSVYMNAILGEVHFQYMWLIYLNLILMCPLWPPPVLVFLYDQCTDLIHEFYALRSFFWFWFYDKCIDLSFVPMCLVQSPPISHLVWDLCVLCSFSFQFMVLYYDWVVVLTDAILSSTCFPL